jgi:hypothetical protein
MLKGNFARAINQITLSYAAVTNKPQFCPKRLQRNLSGRFPAKSHWAETRTHKGKIKKTVFRVKNLLLFYTDSPTATRLIRDGRCLESL